MNDNLTEQQVMDENLQPASSWDIILYLVGGFGLFTFVGSLIALKFNEITLELTILSILLNVFILGGAVVVFGILRKKISWRQLGIYPVRWKWNYLLLAALVAIGLMPIRAFIGVIFQLLFEGGMESLMLRESLFMAGGLSWSGFLISLIGIGILAPISEELYFRGLLQNWFRQKLGFWGGIVSSAILFGLAHFDSIGVLFSSAIMGLALAYLFEKTKSLYLSIAIHSITNSLAVLMLYAMMWATQNYPNLIQL